MRRTDFLAVPGVRGLQGVRGLAAVRRLPGSRTLPVRRVHDGGLRVRAESLLGTVHGVVHTVLNLNPISSGASALAGAGLGAVDSWVLGGTKAALRETADVIGRTTSPQLDSTWFSATYWRVAAGCAADLAVPVRSGGAGAASLRSRPARTCRVRAIYHWRVRHRAGCAADDAAAGRDRSDVRRRLGGW